MAKPASEGAVIKFRALQLANEHRNAYGLRYNDFSRYRNHCGNRTHRLRSTLKMTHGKGRDFKKLPPITLETIKDGHLQLLLFETERAWAYSQELYTNSLQPANKDNAAKLRHSATGRFRRAIHWCTQLQSHCQSLRVANRFSAENMLEAVTYTLIMSGRFLRFKDEFEDALDQLCVARDLLDVLTNTAETSRDQALATVFADEISPEIRYCAHQLGHPKSYDVDNIVKDVAPRQKSALVDGYDQLVRGFKSEGQSDVEGRKRLQVLQWEGQPVPVRNPELVDVLLDVQKEEEQLKVSETSSTAVSKTSKGKGGRKHHKSRGGVAAFDAILAALSEAEEVARKLVEAQQTTGGTGRATDGTRDIHFLHDFIVYHLLSKRIERDLTLVSALVTSSRDHRKHPEKADKSGPSSSSEQTDARVNPAVVKILDTVLQSLTVMRNLTIVDENPDLANAVEARLAFTKSRRCLYLSRSYAAVKQYAQALSLIRKADLYIREASSLTSFDADPINTGSSVFYPLTIASQSELGALLSADELHFKQDWFAHNGGSVKTDKDGSKKPLFFDIALNYVQLDTDRLQERAGIKAKGPVKAPVEPKPVAVMKAKAEEIDRATTPELAKQQGGGLSALLGGWWGRK